VQDVEAEVPGFFEHIGGRLKYWFSKSCCLWVPKAHYWCVLLYHMLL